ncbi:MAG: AmmeMemoRadiSam system protein B [Candidatus Omnitrophota bacterium]|nr:MAG: AmmeMemoRadiSam system protein B [Candidatus Omnitrophota bacterium]
MEKDNIRKPAVAGQFYPATKGGLKKNIDFLVNSPFVFNNGLGKPKFKSRTDAVACILPHAGYMYSGAVAGKTVNEIKVKDRVVLIGPNHTGNGAALSIMSEGSWLTPLGEVKIDSHLAKELLKNCDLLQEDNLAHAYEHSLEVELPFLQYFNEKIEISPIIVLSEELSTLKEIGKKLGKTVKDLGIKDSTLIIASTDMTHYEPYTLAQKKDREAIDAILALDEDGLSQKVTRLNISMCGFAAVAIMLSAAKYLGAENAKLVEYQTSGDITRDYSSVVGYAGIIIY